jgi:hypothetical protein
VQVSTSASFVSGITHHINDSKIQSRLHHDRFDDWLKSPVPPKKVVCQVGGTDDVMFLHALLSTCRHGFVKKDALWSDFTYSHASGKELRIVPQRLAHWMIPEEDRRGVLEEPVSLNSFHTLQLLASKTDTPWFGFRDNNLKAINIVSPGTFCLSDKNV